MRIRLKAVPHELVNHRARRFALDALDDFAGEGVDQHLPRRVHADASRAQIKNALVIQLADGRAVRAFNVVGIDFQLRFRVGRRIVGKQKVFIRLLRIGFLRDRLQDVYKRQGLAFGHERGAAA